MTGVKIPAPIDALIASINEGDTERFLGFFAEDGMVDDWGEEYVGIDAIRTWNDRELIGAKGVMTVRSAERTDSQVVLVADWKSNFFTGPGRFVFLLDGDKVKEWRIREE